MEINQNYYEIKMMNSNVYGYHGNTRVATAPPIRIRVLSLRDTGYIRRVAITIPFLSVHLSICPPVYVSICPVHLIAHSKTC